MERMIEIAHAMVDLGYITQEQHDSLDLEYIEDWNADSECGYSDECIVDKILDTLENN